MYSNTNPRLLQCYSYDALQTVLDYLKLILQALKHIDYTGAESPETPLASHWYELPQDTVHFYAFMCKLI